MQPVTIGRVIRSLRHRRGWRQVDLGQRAGIARSVLSDIEAGRLDRHAMRALYDVVQAVGATLRLDLYVPGGDVSRLLDADHAVMQEAWKALLERLGWTVHAEVTFNHFGERGSIDLLAWHPQRAALLVIEIKSVLVDIRALLAGVDRSSAWRASSRQNGGG